MSAILNTIKFENDVLINFQNLCFPKIKYSTELESDLVFQLQDPTLAITISTAYAKHIAPVLSEAEQNLFSKALLRVCYLFGSPQYPPYRALRLALKEENFPIDSWQHEYQEVLSVFMKEANRGNFETIFKTLEEVAHIVILTTSAAGGNLAVAEGLEKVLREKHSFKVTVIDVEKISEQVDPLMIATGTHTYDRIYAQVIQQANQFQIGFDLQMDVYRNIARYIKPILGLRLKEEIYRLHPDFILSTRNGHQLDVSLSHGLGIPGSILHCDCEVGYYYRDLIGKLDPRLFKIWLPDDLPRVFEPVLSHRKITWELSYQKMEWDHFKNILSQALQVTSKELESQLEFVGAPTRPEIRKIKDLIEIESLRKKWGLKPDVKGVVITMGRNGVGKMREIFSELLTSFTHTQPIKYIFVCGTHQNMQREFEEQMQTHDLSKSALKECLIYGLASPTEMNELLNISSLVIGKPGGSQVEECIKTRIPMMVVFSHEYWESGGQARLQRAGYLMSYDPKETLAKQIEFHVKALSEHKLPKVTGRKWKQLIAQAVRTALKKED